jgi:hypothetical protein
LASAEIYNPITGTFSPTGSMASTRKFFTATLLNNGRVLVAGGDASVGPGQSQAVILSVAELYDPATGKFSPTGSMTAQRRDHAATLLNDGRVLIVGGDNPNTAGLTSAEIYDPSSGRFSPTTGSMAHPRYGQSATRLSDGRVLIVGGFGDSGSSSSAELCQV